MTNRRLRSVAPALGRVALRAFRAPARPVRALLRRVRESRLRERERIRHERISEWNAAALWLHDQSACAKDD